MIQFYIGKVETVLDNHVITFSVDTIADQLSPAPKAVAAMKLTRYPQIGDEVLILRPDSDFEIFLYWLTSDDVFDISLNYDEAYIRIYKDDNDKYVIEANDSQGTVTTMTENSLIAKVGDNVSVEMTNSDITLTTGNSYINIESSQVDVNGHLTVTPY